MAIRKFALLLSVLVAFFGAISVASADGGDLEKQHKPNRQPDFVERVLKSTPVYDMKGRWIGTAELVVHQGPDKVISAASSYSATGVVSSSYTRSRTCWAEFYLKNWYGQKVISFKLYQSFSYNGSRITRLDQPITSVSTKWGWSQSSLSKGKYWRSYPWAARSWASAKFDLKYTWFTVQTYRPTLIIDTYGNGSCYARGYW